MKKFMSKIGKEVELTDERLKHILIFHPELAEHLDRFAEVLLGPDEVRVSVSDDKVLLFHKKFVSFESGKYLRVAVKINSRCFILTAYLTSKLIGAVYEF